MEKFSKGNLIKFKCLQRNKLKWFNNASSKSHNLRLKLYTLVWKFPRCYLQRVVSLITSWRRNSREADWESQREERRESWSWWKRLCVISLAGHWTLYFTKKFCSNAQYKWTQYIVFRPSQWREWIQLPRGVSVLLEVWNIFTEMPCPA